VLDTKPSINDYIHTKLLPDARIVAEFGGVCFFQKPMSQCETTVLRHSSKTHRYRNKGGVHSYVQGPLIGVSLYFAMNEKK